MKPSTFMWTDNRPVLLQIDGPYGRNGLIPMRPLTTKDRFWKIASSAFTLDCLFIVNKAWGTHFYYLTKSIFNRSFFDLQAGQIFCFHFLNSSIQPEKVTQNWGNILICSDEHLIWKSTVTTRCNLQHKNCLHLNWILRIECRLTAASDIITLNWIKERNDWLHNLTQTFLTIITLDFNNMLSRSKACLKWMFDFVLSSARVCITRDLVFCLYYDENLDVCYIAITTPRAKLSWNATEECRQP